MFRGTPAHSRRAGERVGEPTYGAREAKPSRDDLLVRCVDLT